ncbi:MULTISPECIES: hypothetical protein [Halorubrum]|uniref:Uncharacterized protein n=1 Tax=Halorubrum persicum TaxID=1383844 RepID=A0A2G1WLE1_9EURY|nr:hypothetical protein [Halorubrum persicum]PHQ39821.1 hypothetical protein DJ69_04665 [Halorubrum persicum]
MTRTARPRLARIAFVAAAVLVGSVGVVVGDGSATVRSAIEATATATAAASLAGEVPYLAAGGALIGLGIGAVVASGATYWYQSKQIGGRLE